MKKLCFLMTAVIFMMTSCTMNSKDNLSSKQVVKLVNQQFKKEAIVNHYHVLTTGYYEEEDDNARYALRQLAANDIITYKCELIPCKKRESYRERYVKGYNWWTGSSEYGYRTAYRMVDKMAYFVTVELTKKGQSLVVEEAELPVVEKDILDVEIDLSAFPESEVAFAEFPDTTKQQSIEEGADEPVEPVDEWETVAEGDSRAEEKFAYDIAKEKENKVSNLCIAYTIKAISARNIQINPLTGAATAEAIIEVSSSTPMGRIYEHAYKGQRSAIDVKMDYFLDKGWVLNELNF